MNRNPTIIEKIKLKVFTVAKVEINEKKMAGALFYQ